MITNLPFFQNKLIDVEELYKPYYTEAIPSTINTWTETDPNNPNVVRICSWYTKRFKFQKGFDYQFVNNSTQVLSSHPKFEAPYVGHTKLRITQIDNTVVDLWNILPVDWFYIPNGSYCYDEAVNSAKIISTPQMGSNTIQIQDLNQQQATSPTLIEDLAPNQYHIIEKQTQTGNSTSTTIYKN